MNNLISMNMSKIIYSELSAHVTQLELILVEI